MNNNRSIPTRVSIPDYPYGEQQYTGQDLGGHRWTFSQTTADVYPKTWGGVLLGAAPT